MKARRLKEARRKKVWRAALRQENSRQGDTPSGSRVYVPDVQQKAKKRKRRLAEVRSTEKHDKGYRRQKKAAQRYDNKKISFRDTSVCDVEAYHARRLLLSQANRTKEEEDALLFRWMRFEERYKVEGRWEAPQKHTHLKTGLFAYFHAAHSDHSTHRFLIAKCRAEVWLEKGIQSVRETPVRPNQTYTCKKCRGTMECHRFVLQCAGCGHAVPRVKQKDMNMKELECIQEASPSYKRDNHLHEWITRVQELERKVVPAKVKEEVLKSFEKWGFDRRKPTKTLVRKFLRDAGYQRYFEHVPQIMQWLSGKIQVVFTDETVRRIKHVFSQIQEPFERHKPKGRKNFLSYAYVLYKVCELLELDDILHVFTLLKSRQNLMKADNVWKGICSDCGYQFIPTV